MNTLNQMQDKIFNEDCLVGMQAIPDESIDCVVTDCPYHIVGGGCSSESYRSAKGHSQPSGIMNRQRVTKHVSLSGCINDSADDVRAGKMFAFNNINFSDWLPEVYRVLKKGTHCYIMINSRNLKELQTEAEKVGFVFQNLLVWNKSNMAGTPNKYYMQKCEFILMLSKRPARNINDMGQSNLLSCPNQIGKANTHPTAKPPQLLQILIENSTNPNDIVLDPFMGSGATAIACVQSERHYLGYEIDPKYYELSQKLMYEVPKQQSLF